MLKEKISRRQSLATLGVLVGGAGTAILAACGSPSSAPASAPTAPAAAATVAPAPTTVPATVAAATVAPASTPVPAATATSVPAAATNAGSKLNGQIVISVSAQIPDQAQQALTTAYQTAQPGVKLIWEIPSAQTGDYQTWLGTQLAAGSIRPDVVSSNYAATYAHYYDFNQARGMTNPYTGNPWSDDLDWDSYISINPQGQRIMLPTRKVHTNYYYNKELFDQAGAKPPTTWDELVDVCQKLASKNILPISANRNPVVSVWFAIYYFDQYHINWINTVRAQKGDWNYDPDRDDKFVYDPKDPFIHLKYTYNRQRYWRGVRDQELRYDTPEVAELVKNMSEVFPTYANQDLWVTRDSYTPFLQQKAAMIFDVTSALTRLQNDMKGLSPARLEALKLPADTKIRPFDWATFEVVPMQGPLVKSPIRCSESASGEYVGIVDKTQPQTDVTLDFVMFWLSKAGYQPFNDAYIQSGQFTPSGPCFVKGVQDPPEIQKLFAQIKTLGNASASYNFWTTGDGPYEQNKQDLYRAALEKKVTPDEFAKQYQDFLIKNFDSLLEQNHLTKADIDNPAKQPGV